MLGRPHRAREAVEAFTSVRGAGCANVNMDVLWALPGQTLRAWLGQLKEFAQLQPEHLSCYNLTMEEGTPMQADYEHGVVRLPPEREQASMFIQGAEFLEEAGLMHYEISNFARMGYQCRHNLGYWEGEEYIGLGPSATSTLAGARWTNSLSHAAWEKRIQSGKPPADLEMLGPTTRVLELMMLRLRTARGMRVKAYQDLTGRSFFRDHRKLVHALHRNGLIRIRDGYLRLTRSGMLVSDSILAALFDASRNLLEAPSPPLAEPLSERDPPDAAPPARPLSAAGSG
jgi:oxygen-independent coproporphyrinogen-3 oxidase